LYYINENNVETCPQIPIVIGNQQCTALIDTGYQCFIIEEESYNDFKATGLESLELPTQNVVLKSAFTGRTKRVKRQGLIQLKVNNNLLDQIFLISSQLVTPLLIGKDFCMDNHVVIDFPKKAILINADAKESATEVGFVNERRNMDSPVARANDLRTADFPLLPQLDHRVGPSISDPPTLLYNARLPEKNMCLNQLTAEEARFCKEVYDLTSANAEEVNDEGHARGPCSPNRA
jgi:hypothetical protein